MLETLQEASLRSMMINHLKGRWQYPPHAIGWKRDYARLMAPQSTCPINAKLIEHVFGLRFTLLEIVDREVWPLLSHEKRVAFNEMVNGQRATKRSRADWSGASTRTTHETMTKSHLTKSRWTMPKPNTLIGAFFHSAGIADVIRVVGATEKMVLVRPSQITSNNRTYTIHPDELKLPIGSLGRNITSHPSMRAKIRFHDSALSELDAVTLRWDKKHYYRIENPETWSHTWTPSSP